MTRVDPADHNLAPAHEIAQGRRAARGFDIGDGSIVIHRHTVHTEGPVAPVAASAQYISRTARGSSCGEVYDGAGRVPPDEVSPRPSEFGQIVAVREVGERLVRLQSTLAVCRRGQSGRAR